MLSHAWQYWTEPLYVSAMIINILKLEIKDYLNSLTFCVGTIMHLGSQKVNLNEVLEHKNLWNICP